MTAHGGTRRGKRDERFELHGVVVSYEDRPDRCTIYPRGVAHQERVETWISADLDVFDCLLEMR